MRFLLIFLLPFSALAQTAFEIPLWEKGPPGFEDRAGDSEEAKDYWVKNIHNPSLTVYLPAAGKANGTAVVVCPGGGHRLLVFNAEGRDPALFLNSLGITVFVLKYRLAREENSPYQLELHVKEDALRAMRVVASRASEFKIDPDKIGMMGFSAGGEVVSLVAYDSGKGDPRAIDPIERFDGRPDFQILIYPGPLFIPESVPSDAPPAFLLASNNDACCSEPVIKLVQRYREAKAPVELHLFAHGDHAFNMGYRSDLASVKHWPQLLTHWLHDSELAGKEN